MPSILTVLPSPSVLSHSAAPGVLCSTSPKYRVLPILQSPRPAPNRAFHSSPRVEERWGGGRRSMQEERREYRLLEGVVSFCSLLSCENQSAFEVLPFFSTSWKNLFFVPKGGRQKWLAAHFREVGKRERHPIRGSFFRAGLKIPYRRCLFSLRRLWLKQRLKWCHTLFSGDS